MSAPQWWDTLAGPDGVPPANLSRILVGQTFELDERHGGRTVTIGKVTGVDVGVDSERIFVGINVSDEIGGEWVLMGDGTVADNDDQGVGHHNVTCRLDQATRVLA